MLQPIETVYDGYRFRSRLEARWAVFFNTLGIRWEYEKEGYNLSGMRYLPDFWLPDQQCFVEIKGEEPTREEANKARLLALNLNKRVFLFYGQMWIPGIDDTYEHDRYGGGEVIETIEKGAYCYDPLEVSLSVSNLASPCYEAGWRVNENRETYCTGCGETTCTSHRNIYLPGTLEDKRYGDIHISSRQAHLMRAVYIAEILSPYGDSCKLRLNQQGKLQYLAPQYAHKSSEGKQNQFIGRKPIDLPACIEKYKQEFEELLATEPNTCEWGMGTVGILYNEPIYRWRECPLCHKFWITSSNDFVKLPCYKEPTHPDGYDLPVSDRTFRLIDAYEAARQARFEHGERGGRP